MAIADVLIPILTTDGANSFAVGSAQRLHRQRQKKLLPNHLAEIDRVVFVIRHTDVGVLHFLLAVRRSDGLRQEHQIELRIDRNLERIETSAAINLERRFQPADKADLLGVLAKLGRQLHGSDQPEVLALSSNAPGSQVRAT